jgi:ATP-dependent DNA helicase RecG
LTQLPATSLEQLRGVGPRLREKLERIGIVSLQDLLFHLPARYQDRTTIHPIDALRIGGEVVVQGRIASSRVQLGRRRSLLTEIHDDSGALTMRQFHFSRSQQDALRPGAWIRCFGEVRRGPRALEMVHPEYSVFPSQPPPMQDDAGFTPVYPATQGLGQSVIRRLVDQALEQVDQVAQELLPDTLLQANRFPSIADALRQLHHPGSEADATGMLRLDHPARVRLAFEELLAHHLAAWQSRRRRHDLDAAVIQVRGDLWQRLRGALAFSMTDAQLRAIDEIRADLGRGSPAHRLIQGDVGSGKTLVAAAACLDVIEAGYQAALMAPTEILAEQHLRNFLAWLQPLGIHVAVLLGRQGVRERRAVLEAMRSGVSTIGDRYPCAVSGQRRIPSTGIDRRRRATPVWRHAAVRIAREGPPREQRTPPVDHDSDSHTALPGDVPLCRDGRHHHR